MVKRYTPRRQVCAPNYLGLASKSIRQSDLGWQRHSVQCKSLSYTWLCTKNRNDYVRNKENLQKKCITLCADCMYVFVSTSRKYFSPNFNFSPTHIYLISPYFNTLENILYPTNIFKEKRHSVMPMRNTWTHNAKQWFILFDLNVAMCFAQYYHFNKWVYIWMIV